MNLQTTSTVEIIWISIRDPLNIHRGDRGHMEVWRLYGCHVPCGYLYISETVFLLIFFSVRYISKRLQLFLMILWFFKNLIFLAIVENYDLSIIIYLN